MSLRSKTPQVRTAPRADQRYEKAGDFFAIAAPTRTQRLAYSALLASLALIFSYIEVLIPFNFGIPGVKLGIANLVVIVALYYLGPRYAFVINMIRVFVAGLLFTGLFGCLYSLAGALLSFAMMLLIKKTGLFSVTGVSICGGVFHNLGQILVATVLVSSLKMFTYFPVLIISGVISGTIIGIVAWLILQRLPRA